jgi:protein tyrosine/serine phosphatase
LWRIKECEELLRNRVSEKFVMDALHSLDEKIKNQINYNNEKNIERLEKSFKELGARVTQTNQFFNDKLDDIRKIMASYDARLSNVATT